jgi:hypothetical protein
LEVVGERIDGEDVAVAQAMGVEAMGENVRGGGALVPGHDESAVGGGGDRRIGGNSGWGVDPEFLGQEYAAGRQRIEDLAPDVEKIRIDDDVAVVRKCSDGGPGQHCRVIGDGEFRAERVGAAVEDPPGDVAGPHPAEGPIHEDHQSLVAGCRHRGVGFPEAGVCNLQSGRLRHAELRG